MKTREELLAMAEAIEEVIEHYYRAEDGGAEYFAFALMDEWESRARELRAQAAQVKEQEPVAYPHTWDETGERCKVCGDKDWMGGSCTKPTEHTAEKNPEEPSASPVAESQAPAPEAGDAGVAPRQDGRGPDAVDVLDVAWLIVELKRYDAGFGMPVCGKAATALAALQAQLVESKRSEMWLGNDNDSWKIAHEKQAEQIKEMQKFISKILEVDYVSKENHLKGCEILERTT